MSELTSTHIRVARAEVGKLGYFDFPGLVLGEEAGLRE
jgi:DNA replication protein DnaC